MEAFKVLRPGLLTTVQDAGRVGYQKFGVPVAGALDQTALRVGNLLVGNAEGEAALEVTALGPRLLVLADVAVALTGAGMEATVDDLPLPPWQTVVLRRGNILDLGRCRWGVRAYLAVAGGLEVPVLLRSKSTCLVAAFGGYGGRALRAGDRLSVGAPAKPLEELEGRAVLPPDSPDPDREVLRVVLGPQDDRFTPEGIRTFLGETYRVTVHADRMGYRLDGPAIRHVGGADIISDYIPAGGVQVPGDGKPIVLLADRQTTGGYAKIATVIRPDLDRVAQLRPGDAVRFRQVTAAEAQGIWRAREAAFRRLAAEIGPPERRRSYRLVVEGSARTVEVEDRGLALAVSVGGRTVTVAVAPAGTRGLEVPSPLPGLVTAVHVEVGQEVRTGERLVSLQAMKMEHEVVADRDGRVAAVAVRPGQEVRTGACLIAWEASAGGSAAD